jgi:nucleotide-binding universal stress UspA family protein
MTNTHSKYLVCIDESSNADKVIQFVNSFVNEHSTIILFNVHKSVSAMLDGSFGSFDDMAESMNKQFIEDSEQLLKRVGHQFKMRGIEVKAYSAGGDPRTMIEDRINEEKPDLVILGRRGLGRLNSFLMGSVSNHIANAAHVSVAVVP